MSGPVSAWMGDRLGIPGVVGIKTGYVGADMTGLGPEHIFYLPKMIFLTK